MSIKSLLFNFSVILITLASSNLAVVAQSQRYPNNAEIRELSKRFSQVPSNVNSKKIPGTVVFSNSANRSYTRIEKINQSGVYVIGKKDIEQISRNVLFSLFIYQDGLVQPVLIENGKTKYINQDSYLFTKLIKVAEKRFVLHASRDYYKGGDDYYDIDLRKINNPVITKINLTTAQRLHK